MFSREGSEIGLVLTYLLMMSNLSSIILFTSSNIAKSASSIERIHEYATWTDHERSLDKPKPSNSWPQSGKVTATGVSVRYRENLPLVISDLSFGIDSG